MVRPASPAGSVPRGHICLGDVRFFAGTALTSVVVVMAGYTRCAFIVWPTEQQKFTRTGLKSAMSCDGRQML